MTATPKRDKMKLINRKEVAVYDCPNTFALESAYLVLMDYVDLPPNQILRYDSG
jgi:hypothetical protein